TCINHLSISQFNDLSKNISGFLTALQSAVLDEPASSAVPRQNKYEILSAIPETAEMPTEIAGPSRTTNAPMRPPRTGTLGDYQPTTLTSQAPQNIEDNACGRQYYTYQMKRYPLTNIRQLSKKKNTDKDRTPAPLTMESGGNGVVTEQQNQESEKVNFIVGDEDGQDDGQENGDMFSEEEATDLFPSEGNPPTRENSSSSNLNNMFALAEKRKRLRPSMSQGTVMIQQKFQEKDFTVGTPEEFVRRFGGTKVINKILIANNGIAAVKCMRSIRRWSYEMFKNERAIRFVVMVTPEDLKANAEYIKMADHYVPVPGGANNNNYANVELILDIAIRTQVQAVWAGWGHASENPKLPELLHKNNISFIGPSEKAMWALGDKIASNFVAQTAEVPTLPWSGSGILVLNL
ncbi:hypothetical protein L9F63_013318, partial [Diploptera punctata]